MQDRPNGLELEKSGRQGAHRARPNAVLALIPILAIAALTVGVVALAWTLLFGGDSPVTTSSGSAASSSAASGVSGTAAASSSASSAASSSASASAASSPAPIDKSITLNYYNGTDPNIAGQARKAEAALQARGWGATGVIKTWTGPAVSVNTVFYASADQQSTAEAVLEVIGGGEVRLDPARATNGLAVVVGNNFTP